MADKYITTFNIHNTKYNLEISLHKKGQNPEDGCILPAYIIHSFFMVDTIFNPFVKLIVEYESDLGMIVERVKPDDYYSDQTGQKKVPKYVYEYAGKDFVHVLFENVRSEKNPDARIPTPLIDSEFVVVSKKESAIQNVFDPATKTTTTLELIPLAQWKLMTTFPQWTTGYDKEYATPSGKKTGLCIKELLELAEQTIDTERFDLGGPTVNMTSLVNESALETILKLYELHTSDSNDYDPCVFKHNPSTDKFTMIPLCDLMSYDQSKDDVKSYDQILLISQAAKAKKEISNVTPKASDIHFDIETLDDTMDTNALQAIVSRRKSTFVIDGRDYNVDYIEKHIKDKYYKDPIFGDGIDQTKIIVPYSREEAHMPVNFIRSPRWRDSERMSINMRSIFDKFSTSQTIRYSVPGMGGLRRIQRKFVVRMYGGAIDEFTSKILGVYITTRLSAYVSPKFNVYTDTVEGKKILPSKYEKFSLTTLEGA